MGVTILVQIVYICQKLRGMLTIKRVLKPLPNTITLLNLVSGCLSITAAFSGNLQMAGVLIIVSGILDFCDGFTARLIGAYSSLGKELDSLSDVVSFGVAPAVIMYHLLRNALQLPATEGLFDGHWILVVPFFIAAMSSLRLAIFNLDTRQTTSFIGLATPANALLIAGLTFGMTSKWANLYSVVVSSPIVLVVLTVVLSLLLVCEMPMFSLKIKSLNPKVAYKQLMLIFGGVVLLIVYGKASLSFVMVWYILLSLIFWICERGKKA